MLCMKKSSLIDEERIQGHFVQELTRTGLFLI